MEKMIMKVPTWEGEILFTYDTVSFLLVVATLAMGLVLCFMGYKYLQMLCLAVLGCIVGMVGVRAAEGLTHNLAFKMFLFATFTFLGICLLYGLSVLMVSVLNKIHLREKCARHSYLFSAFFGAGVVGTVTYMYVYRSILAVLALSVVLFVAGALWGRRQAARRKVFHTYDDLCERKPLAGEGGEPCSMSAEES